MPTFTLPDHVKIEDQTLQTLVLRLLQRGAFPGRSWAEHPLPMLVDALRFFLHPPDEWWRAPVPGELPSEASSVLSSKLTSCGGGADRA